MAALSRSETDFQCKKSPPSRCSFGLLIRVYKDGHVERPPIILNVPCSIHSELRGNRMRGTLFGDQIETFEEALQYLVETVIQPVHPELGLVLPNYQPIATIPRAVDPDERYGVVLYVEEEPRRVEGKDGGRESLVREIVILIKAVIIHSPSLSGMTLRLQSTLTD
uniref:Uncharacterized protein n=1 Tax=Chenopodium quinoa TaxID=63459 RepID=A0A803L3P5_CHEQI